MSTPKIAPDGWPPIQRAASPAIVQRDPYAETRSQSLQLVTTIDARRCAHCGCYAAPRVADPTDDHRDLSNCARGDLAIPTDEEDPPGLDWMWTHDDRSPYFAPVACAECLDRKGGCQFPSDGWDFTVEWVEKLPPDQKLSHELTRDSTCLRVAAVGSVAEAIAVAKKQAGDAYAHKIEGRARYETFGLFMGSLVGDFPEVDPPDLELIPCRCIP